MHPKPLNILISPLDWGLGHASRCVPVIRQLNIAGHKVTISGSGRSLIMLQKEFPYLESIEMHGFSPSYSKSGNMVLHLFMLLPRFIRTIFSEHSELKKLIIQYHFDVIISDNRYGLWNKKVRSILISHQVMIKTPAWLRFFEYPLYRISRFLISRFDECWIPDDKESPGLSGDLSHKYPLPENAKFIGPLSRFQKPGKSPEKETGKGQITAIISGPEPQRSLFEDIVTKQLAGLNQKAAIISGKPETENIPVAVDKLTILPHLPSDELSSLIRSSSIVICRPGYSSIMDIQAMGAKALFVPTPGQTEQIYLAELHEKAGTALFRNQETLNLKVDIEKAVIYSGYGISTFVTDLVAAVLNLKKK